MSAQNFLRKSLRPRLGAAVLGFGLTAFFGAHASDGKSHIGEGASGNYLAGRHAEQVGENLAALKFYSTATTRGDIASTDLHKRIYILALSEGRIDDALKALDKIEGAGDTVLFANLVRAVHALKINNFARVEPLLEGEDKGLVRLLAPAMIAWAKVGEKDLKGAFEALEKMKEQSALEALYELHAALIEDAAGDPAKAEKHFLAVLEKAGLSTRVAQLLGRHFERLGQDDKAHELYSKFTHNGEGAAMLAQAEARRKKNRRPPVDVATPQAGAAEVLFNIASVLQSQAADRRVQVLAHLALYLRSDLETAQIVLAATLDANARYEEANAIYAKIPKSSPLSWNARMRMADNLDRMERTDDAVKLLRALARERLNHEVALVELGDVLRRHERFKEASKAYSDALKRVDKIENRHWTIYYARGIA